MKYMYGFFMAVLFLTGCGDAPEPEPEVKGNQYTLEECKEELLEAEDFSQGESIDKIVVVKKERKMYLYKDNKVQQYIACFFG